ncbi:MAG: DegV family EDD domain-containing protein [Oscillospiraceae bacterium]|jgi:DegV family protein with EDD domain|nr:DegV family EDD domain-containing protein [Oscillospiraceae bacterium]
MGSNYVILGDMSFDLSPELRQRFGVDGYFKGHLSTPEADDIEGRLDLSDAELDEFYASLKANKNKYKTAAAGVDEIVLYFETFLQQGNDILALSISSKLSTTFNIMERAKERACEKYPERKVIIVDTLKFSVAIGLLTVRACEFRAMGYSLEQNAEKLDEIKKTLHQMGSVDDLFWVASKGRISHAKAFFGTIAGIKSMGDFDADGLVTALAKVSGYEKVYKTIIEYIKKTIKSASEQIVFVAHSARREQAEILASEIRAKIKPKEVIVCNIYPMSGINAGPGLLAAYYFGTEITDLKYEKDVINEIIKNL